MMLMLVYLLLLFFLRKTEWVRLFTCFHLQQAQWHNGKIKLKLSDIYRTKGMLEAFVDAISPLVRESLTLESMQQKVFDSILLGGRAGVGATLVAKPMVSLCPN
ncbi:hypothetical protein Ancab_007143 [Ancistrocladus abbreviatus]